MAGKQAKTVADGELQALLNLCGETRYPERNRVVVLLSFKAGLRAMEIAKIRRYMVLDNRGLLDTEIHLENRICKKGSGRTIPMAEGTQLHDAVLKMLKTVPGLPSYPLILSERAMSDDWTKANDEPRPMSPASICYLFYRLYEKLQLLGCSSHSGRRTFITKAARAVQKIDGSLRDVQYLAGHSSLTTTQGYIEINKDVHERLSKLL